MTSLHKARLAAWILAVMTVLAAFRGLGDDPTPAKSPQAEAQGGPSSESGLLQPGEFRRRNPFSFVRVHPPPAPPVRSPTATAKAPPPAQPSKVELPLKLNGTVASGPFGMAFLRSSKTQDEFVLSPGADVGKHLGKGFTEIKLIEVGRKRAVFRRDQEEWVLEVGEGIQGAALSVASPVVPPSNSQAAPAVQPEPTSGAPVAVERTEIERATRNLAYLVTQLSVQPYFESGKPAGVRVSRIRPESLFARLGLKNGDVLKGVGDQKVTSLRETVKVLQAFQRNEAVQVKVLRGGRLQDLSYQIR